MYMAALKYFIFAKRLVFQITSVTCFVGIDNGIMVPNLNSVFPIESRFVHGKRYSVINKSLALMSVSKTTSSFHQKTPTNDFNLNSKFCLFQIVSLWIKMIGN